MRREGGSIYMFRGSFTDLRFINEKRGSLSRSRRAWRGHGRALYKEGPRFSRSRGALHRILRALGRVSERPGGLPDVRKGYIARFDRDLARFDRDRARFLSIVRAI